MVFPMTKQLSIQLPDDLVAFLDEQKESGQAKSRNATIAKALRRERRRALAERDAAIYAAHRGDDPDDLGALARYASKTKLDVD